MTNASFASQLESGLQLSRAPIAAAWVDAPPAGVAVIDHAVPSTCALWTLAERGAFYAPAAAHANCPVGAMTMGFELTEDTQSSLMTVVHKMIGDGYIGADEPAAIPKVQTPAQGIVYGKLAEFPVDPDVVLMWLDSGRHDAVQRGLGRRRLDGRAARDRSGATHLRRPSAGAELRASDDFARLRWDADVHRRARRSAAGGGAGL